MAQDLIHSFETPQEVAEAVANAFVQLTNQCIADTGSCVVAISGGTTPNTLFELLNTDEYRKQLDWERIYFCGLMNALFLKLIQIIISIVPRNAYLLILGGVVISILFLRMVVRWKKPLRRTKKK